MINRLRYLELSCNTLAIGNGENYMNSNLRGDTQTFPEQRKVG